jgi:hypothetical protein
MLRPKRTEEHPDVHEQVTLGIVQELCKVGSKPPTNTDVYGDTSRSISERQVVELIAR